jgi:hypothetical protein
MIVTYLLYKPAGGQSRNLNFVRLPVCRFVLEWGAYREEELRKGSIHDDTKAPARGYGERPSRYGN